MKFIKYAVGLVIALSVIPIVVVAVNNLDQPILKTVEFEVIDYDTNTGGITFSDNTYNNIHSLAIVETGIEVSNLVTVKVNEVNVNGVSLEYYLNEYTLNNDDNLDWETLGDDDIASGLNYEPTIGDKWEMTFEVPSPTPSLVKLLVGFAPLLFIGGILLFMLNKRKLT